MHSKNERILILGAGQMQEPALKAAAEMGLKTVVVDGNPAACCVSLASTFVPLDLKDKDAIFDLARALYAEADGLSAVFTAGTDFSTTVAYVAEKLGLPGNGYKTAVNTTDKAVMRSVFDKAGIPSPAFMRVSPNDTVRPPAFGFPAVVKPTDNMGGRGCRKVAHEAQLYPAVADALRFSRSGAAIVEQFIDGPEFSVDSIVYKGKIYITGLADRHIYFPPYFIEMGHTMPAALDKAASETLLDVFKSAVRALGITSGCAKGDIKLSAAGPVIGEIASRLSGGYMSGWTYPYASGVELTKAAILVALGRERSEVEAALHRTRDYVSAERAFISIPGRVHEICGLEEARNTPYVKNVFLRSVRGTKVDFPQNNVSKCGNVISAAEWREQAVHAAESACRNIQIPLEYPNDDTERFLFEQAPCGDSGARFPPDAFTQDVCLRESCAALPLTQKSAAPLSRDSQAALFPFPAFYESALTDWLGRTVRENLAIVRRLSSLELPFAEEGGVVLGREFWQAFIRGAYQGALYYICTLYGRQMC